MERYYSQNGQDLFLDNLFRGQRDGRFLDIGAYDGATYSNTLFLERFRNWGGVCVEPNHVVFSELQKNRRCKVLNAAIAKEEKESTYFRIYDACEMLGGLLEEFDDRHLQRIKKDVIGKSGGYAYETVSCLSFERVTAENFADNHIDYCSMDTEGSELSILQSIDFNKVSVTVFSIENTYEDPAIHEILSNNGYDFVTRIGEDDFFVLKSAL